MTSLPGAVKEPPLSPPDSSDFSAPGTLLYFGDNQRLNVYATRLLEELGRAPNVPVGNSIVRGIVHRFAEWEYTNEVNPSVHYLTRRVMDTSVELSLTKEERGAPKRSIHRDRDEEGAGGTLTIMVRDEIVRATDLITFLEIEGQYPDQFRRKEAKARRKEASSEAAVKFHEAKNVYLNDDDILTQKETVTLSYTTLCPTPKELSELLESKPKTINTLISSVRDRIGMDASPGSADTYIELMLVALSLEIASIKHVPKSATYLLTANERQLLAKYYSPDPEIRAAYRSTIPGRSITTKWSDLYKKLGDYVEDRHSAILYAVKNDILQLPDSASIIKLLAQARENAK